MILLNEYMIFAGLLILVILIILGTLLITPEAANQCEEILGGAAMKRCHYTKGHTGPHQTHWAGRVWDFKAGTKLEYHD
jgi:hypothetical protein